MQDDREGRHTERDGRHWQQDLYRSVTTFDSILPGVEVSCHPFLQRRIARALLLVRALLTMDHQSQR